MKELHLIEGRNTGFPNALNALRENGSDKFIIEMDEDRQYLSVIIPVHPAFLPRKKKSVDDYENKILGESKIEVLQNKILSLLGEASMTITGISKALGYKGITKKLRTSLDMLVMEGRIEKRIEGGDIVYKTMK